MAIVSPSILSADYLNLERDIKTLESAGAQYLHIDVMDGSFVPSISYGPNWVKQIKAISNMVLDVHLMIVNPEKYIDTFAQAGADLIGVHVEATPHIHRALQMIKNVGAKAEVVINPGTPVESIKPILGMVDQVLVMTVNPGFGGQKFLPETAEKIKELHELEAEHGYKFDIEVDGGITDVTGKVAVEAGANVLVAGSFVFNGDVEANVKKLLAL